MSEHPRWAEEVPLAESYRAPRGRSAAEAVAEQDTAAGGRSRREIAIGGERTALASVELKLLPKSRRVYAYLRYQDGSRTLNRYIGEAPGEDRPERLRAAWREARRKGLLD